MTKSGPIWLTAASYYNKSRAKSHAKMLRLPGKHRVRARVVKETSWRVDYAALSVQSGAEGKKDGGSK